MRLSLSILLLVAAATQISAAVTPRAPATCISGSQGKGLGDGFKGYCCDDESDCIDDCIKGICAGPVNAKTTTTTTKTTTTATTTPTTGACIPGSKGLGNGDGYNGYCCSNSDDCINSCVKGKCNGPTNTKTTTTTTSGTKTTTTATTTPTSSCKPGSKGLGKGDGKTGYCCSDDNDCVDTCNAPGVCGVHP